MTLGGRLAGALQWHFAAMWVLVLNGMIYLAYGVFSGHLRRHADQVLQPKYGFPWKLRIPTKLGFKNPKHVTVLFVTNENPGGYWEDKGYNWYSGS